MTMGLGLAACASPKPALTNLPTPAPVAKPVFTAEQAKALATSECLACHGPVSTPYYPTLRGMSAEEIALALRNFKSGTKTGRVMPQIVKTMSEEQIAKVAAYLGGQSG